MVETGGERCREDGNGEISESQKLGENQKHSQHFFRPQQFGENPKIV